MTESPQHDMALTRIFTAPLQKVWEAWSESDMVRQWWGPTGFTCPVADMDFREGGTSLVCMRAPADYGGGDMYNTWTYTKILPLELIEFTQHFTDKDRNRLDPAALGLPPGIPGAVPHRITFTALSDEETEITVTEFGYPTPDMVEISKAGMAQCLDKMAAIFGA